jgi:hypothetical protein
MNTQDLPYVRQPTGLQLSLQTIAARIQTVHIRHGQVHLITAVRATVTQVPAGRVHPVTAARAAVTQAPAGRVRRATVARVILPVQDIPGPAAVPLRPIAIREVPPTVQEAIPVLPIPAREEEDKTKKGFFLYKDCLLTLYVFRS